MSIKVAWFLLFAISAIALSPTTGTATWKRTPKQIWTVHGENKGWAKVSGNLWFVLVNKAGHMVPTDQPEAAFNMLGHFIFDNKEWRE